MLADERSKRQQLTEELSGVKSALAREEDIRRKIEAANVQTLQELRAQEDARWEAERRAQAETVRCTELEALARRTEEECTSRVEGAEARESKAINEAKTASQRYVEAERMRVALQGRVTALEGVKVQLEQQLALEREACAVELRLRQKAEAACAEAQRSSADAQQAAADATQAAEVAKAALEQATTELAACEERLRVANDGSLDQQMASASAEEAVRQLKALRTEDATKMQRLNTERATLQQKVDDLEARLSSTVAQSERSGVEVQKQRYELHAQLTEVHRRCEDLQAQATRAELLLQHERESSLTASDHEKRLAAQLDGERRAKQALSQQLAAEAALRQKSDASENARSKELVARERENELGAQRLQALQAELHRAREEGRLAREAMADARAIAVKMERERDVEREEARRERARRDAAPGIGLSKSASLALSRSATHASNPSLQASLTQPPRGGLEPPPPARHPKPQAEVTDELSRSDIWNFSEGSLAHAGGRGSRGMGPGGGGVGGGAPTELPRIKSPFNTASGAAALAPTSLAPEEARALYGNAAIPGLAD